MSPTCRAALIVIGIPPSNWVSFQFILDKARISSAKYRGVVHKNILARILSDETETFLVVPPFHFATGHNRLS